MSQGNWGGPPGGGGPGGWGGGPPGAPPGGGYGPPPGGGYGPPGGAPPGGYGPPGGAPPGGYGPPGGAPPGGYGPPGGAPPGGYGPPPGGGYGPPPGGAGYGPPPGDYGAPPGGAMMGGGGGQRVQFTGEGGKLLVTFLLFGLAPAFGGGIISAIFTGIGVAIDGGGGSGRGRHHGPGPIALTMQGIGSLLMLAIVIAGSLFLYHKIFEFRWQNTIVDGQRCNYSGTPGGLLKAMILPFILTYCTMGIYTPWMMCKLWSYVYENVEVNGQRGRLTFQGDGGQLIGKWILGLILTYCTMGIYGAWFVNDIFAFYWENSKIDGRGFGFRKDPGGFLGTYILTMILTYCTMGIYAPWGMCNIIKWESERVT